MLLSFQHKAARSLCLLVWTGLLRIEHSIIMMEVLKNHWVGLDSRLPPFVWIKWVLVINFAMTFGMRVWRKLKLDGPSRSYSSRHNRALYATST
jgi:hypothetical protein